ncbi:MAG: TraB/GumN family protein [Candidatus Kapaibacterium sp.]
MIQRQNQDNVGRGREHRSLRFTIPILFPILTIWLIGCSSSSQSDDEGRYPLWKIEGKQNTVWILGSVHLLPERAHPLPKAFEEAYAKADRVVFEVDLDTKNMEGAMMGMMSEAMLPMGETLEDVLKPETWELLEPRLDALAESMGEAISEQMGSNLPINGGMLKTMLTQMEPWFVGVMLQQTEADMKEYKAELGVDLYYANKAKEDGKETSGLETIEEQMGFLKEMAGEDTDLFIRTMLEQVAPEADMFDNLVDAWLKGDLKGLEHQLNDSMKETPGMRDLLLTQRNKKWVPQIEDYLNDEEDYLVIVGAGHLVGDDSVIDLLRKRGVKVKRI